MFGLKPKLPIAEDDRAWVDDGFRRLGRMLGDGRMLTAEVVLPSDEFFPDPFQRSAAGAEVLFRRVCGYLRVNPADVDLEIIPDDTELLEDLPAYSLHSNDPAGLHFGKTQDERALIAVKQSKLKDPFMLTATLAHELCHVILLDGGKMSRNAKDMEPMTDLATIFLGMGIFTANSARRFLQFQDDRRQGWSMNRLGYLPEEVYGYALALFAQRRNEIRPSWAKYLNTNVATYFARSNGWLSKNKSALR